MHSFFLPPNAWAQHLFLEGSEAHHLLRVLRLKPGEDVTLLDGRGREAVCRIVKTSRQSVELAILRERTHPEPGSRVILAAGWGKAARRGWILEKAVELEASALWFWQADRSQFPVPGDIHAKWEGQLIAGAKQCRNPWLPELRTLPGGVDELIAAAKDCAHKQALVESDYAHQAFLDDEALGLPGDTVCVVGPEGGFSPREVHTLENAGFKTLSMGTRILRWETAAVMALGLHWWKRQEHAADKR
ncbi:MAG: 16S rRNA (uracil(1498)-N(3))-methyltransferase [Desulfovibrionaceae bacterium]|nr:16S rRNA (uracil(1498)-N(3))-methyltransferase [Desulfovibrionaceae bacterium]